MTRYILLILLLVAPAASADPDKTQPAAAGVAGTDSSGTKMLERIESTDYIANRYWEELLLTDNRQWLYFNVLPHIAYRSASPQQEALSGGVGRIIAKRFSPANGELQTNLDRLLGRRKPSGAYPRLHLRLMPYEQEISQSDNAPVHRLGATAESWISPSANWQVHLRARVENHGELYSQFNGRKWQHDITGWFDNAAAYYYRSGFFASIGRSFFIWGPEQHDALLISDNAPAFDRIWMGYEHKAFRFDYFIARLDDFHHGDSTLVRYLSAHRLSFRKGGLFELGFSEVALYGGYNRPIEWRYLNPFVPYYWEQYNRGSDDNMFLGIDGAIYWPRKSRIFGELMIDDFQIDFVSEPQQVGYKIGIDALEPFGAERLFTKLSYTRVNTTVYGQFKFQNLYLDSGQPIGFFGGNDLDRWLALARYHLGADCDLEVELQYNRHGEGKIEEHAATSVPKHVKFPSGIVQKSPSIRAGAEFFHSQYLQGHLYVSYAHFSNYQNIEGRSHNQTTVDLLLSYYLQGLFD